MRFSLISTSSIFSVSSGFLAGPGSPASKRVKAAAAWAVRERPVEEENSISNKDPTQPAFRTAASHQVDDLEVLEVLEVMGM